MQSKLRSIFLLLLILTNCWINAQTPAPTPTPAPAPAPTLPAPVTPPVPAKASLPPKVVAVYNSKYPDSTSAKHNIASIGDIIVVRVANFDPIVKQAQCDSIEGCTPQKIGLFINGQLIKAIAPISGAPQKIENTNLWELRFQLDRNADNDEIWATILGSPPFFSRRFFIEEVAASVGLQNGAAIATSSLNEFNFQLERIHKAWFWACLFIELGLLVITIIWMKKGLLRDRPTDLINTGLLPTPASGPFRTLQPNQVPYSLGRLQMAFWFILIIASYLFIWLITDAYNILSASVLALIGISAGTSLSAITIDNSKRDSLINATIQLQKEVADPAITPTDKAQKDKLIDANLKELGPHPTEGFFKDILEDVNGMSFHRLQMLTWTLVLGMIFVYTVWKRLSMPDFDAALLALTGITAGTYLGFKFPEKQS